MIAVPQIFDQRATVDQRLAGVRKLVTSLKQDAKRPILLGPWRSELGFEALYWMPFLRWLSGQVKGFDQRACVVTRGGLAPLYANVASHGYDLYAVRDVKDVRRENLKDYQKTALQKQTAITDWDTQALTDAARQAGIGPVYDVVHPAWMYWAFTPYWEEQTGLRYLSSMTTYDALPKLPKPDHLPAQYVAVKWYGRATFPYPEPDVSQFIQRLCGVMAAQIPLVVVSAGGVYDDHVDVPLSGPNIVTLPSVKADENLLQQAAVMQHAKAVVGTYGGAMQLALRMGVASVSFWKVFGGTAAGHLTLSHWLANQTTVSFLTGSMSETHLWQQVLTPPVMQMPPMSMAQPIPGVQA